MIGLGTYAFFWQHSARAPQPLDLAGMLRQTHELNGEVFQICDYPPIQDYSGNELRSLRELAGELGIVLELGTKGIATAHLDSYLRLAESLGVRLVRSMVNTPDHRPGLSEAEQFHSCGNHMLRAVGMHGRAVSTAGDYSTGAGQVILPYVLGSTVVYSQGTTWDILL